MVKPNKIIIAFLCIVATVFVFLTYSFLSFTSVGGGAVRLNSPDETANYFFARTFAKDSQIGYEEPLLEVSKGVVHARSMTTAGSRVVPVGFLGLTVLYGTLAKVFGVGALLFFTPFLAVVTAFAFYFLLKRIFSRTVAALSGVLLLIHPAYRYYASRGMLPNVLFVDLLILGALCLAIAYEKKRHWLSFVGGILLGAALTVRLSEMLWVLGAGCILALVSLRRRTLPILFLCVLGLAVPLGIFFSLNKAVYGHPLLFGYQMTATYESVSSLDKTLNLLWHFDPAALPALQASMAETIAKARVYAFPFGFEPATFSLHFNQYGVTMFWWFSLLVAFGFFIVLRNALYDMVTRHRFRVLVYTGMTLFVGFWLTAFYGSWIFFDNSAEEVTIGNSYVRYWLPMYLLSIPFAASTLAAVMRGRSASLARFAAATACVIVLMYFSGNTIFIQFRDSQLAVAKNIKSYQDSARQIQAVTPPDAVIFSERSDKNFFPERKVAQSFKDFAEKDLVPPLVERVPVYYYGLWSELDAEYISRHYFSDYNLHWEHTAEFGNNERLFRVVKNGE